MPWVIEDVYGAGVCSALHKTGELRNPYFPAEVGATESWTGTIEAVNIGESKDTFRIRVNGEAGEPFDLNPGESRTITESGVGPSEFTIFLERWTIVEVPWYKKYAKEVAIISVAGVVGIVIMAKR